MARYILTFTTPGGNYVYDREVNALLSVSTEEFAAFKRIEDGEDREADWVLLERYTNQGYLHETKLKEIEHPATQFLRNDLESSMRQITMQVTQSCNLRCLYCAYGGSYDHQRTHSNKTMTLETMKKCVDFIMSRSRNIKEIAIGFYGGEPLLEIDNIVACIDYINEAYTGRPVHYTVTTNGTVFNDEMVSFLEKNDFTVFISLDGPKELHDKNRVFENGKGSFEVIMSNVAYLKTNFPLFFHKVSFITTVAPGSDFSCVRDFYSADSILANSVARTSTVNTYNSKKEIEYDDLYYITSKYERMKVILAELGLYSRSKTTNIFSNALDTPRRIQKDLSRSVIFEKSHPSGPCVPGIMRPYMDVNGDIFPCERVSENSEVMKIGNIDTGFDYAKVESVLNVGKLSELECKECWNFIHCSLCVAACDGGSELSSEKRLENCLMAKYETYDALKTICLLLENGYDFEPSLLNMKG